VIGVFAFFFKYNYVIFFLCTLVSHIGDINVRNLSVILSLYQVKGRK